MSAEKIIKDNILDNGPISISSFMTFALSHPKYGYYQKNNPFGIDGDFITSPEISQVFGELIGIWCVSVWVAMGKPKDFCLVEMGAGKGTLMVDLLRGTKHVKGFHESFSIHMVENSSRLTLIQKEALEDKHDNIQWHEDFLSIPKKPIIFIANELFDALPIEQYVKRGQNWLERKINLDISNNLVFCEEPALMSPILNYNYQGAEDGDFVEISPASIYLLDLIAKHIEQYGGIALIIDYGYVDNNYDPTLQAVKNHKYHNVLEQVGNADITAHVDFDALQKSIIRQNLNVYDIISQRRFLNNMGIALRQEKLISNKSKKDAQKIIKAIERLVDPEGMGMLFKVLTFSSKNIDLNY
jgi:NADH dehydrogenase [ubiquinone] 1 alpha subcomplex assembly factor 7